MKTIKTLLVLALVLFTFTDAFSTSLVTAKESSITQNSKKYHYNVTAKYPLIEGGEYGAGNNKFNKLMDNTINKKIKEFISDVKHDDIGIDELPEELRNYTMDIKSSFSEPFPGIATVEFETYSFYAGRAHPLTVLEAMNFDLRNGKVLQLQGLFSKKPEYLNSLSSYCKKHSKVPISFEEGIEPKPENFENFLITKTGLKIIFNAYQIAPYAAGPSDVTIPFSYLSLKFPLKD